MKIFVNEVLAGSAPLKGSVAYPLVQPSLLPSSSPSPRSELEAEVHLSRNPVREPGAAFSVLLPGLRHCLREGLTRCIELCDAQALQRDDDENERRNIRTEGQDHHQIRHRAGLRRS